MYAMKVLDKAMLTDQRKLKQIENERRIMNLIDHPFIVKLYWAFQTNTTLNFVMDLWVGGELFYRLKKEKRLPEEHAKFYLIELLLAFEYLHNKNIVYRDLKPENVLIDVDGHVKLADFGLSKEIKNRNTNSFWGSPEYMSPEMLRGDGHDWRLDIYWLGAILFEMLTGLPPHYSRSVNEMYLRIIEDEVKFPLFVSKSAESLMSKMLEKEPWNRFQSIEEIKQHEWFDGVNWDAYVNKTIEPAWKPNLHQSNFDPEYTNMPIDFADCTANQNQDSRRGGEFWMENIYSWPMESHFSSRTVTEQSIWQSFISDINVMANFNIPSNLSGYLASSPRNPANDYDRVNESTK